MRGLSDFDFVCQPPMIIMGCLKLLKLISKSNVVERPSVIIDHHALLAEIPRRSLVTFIGYVLNGEDLPVF